MFKKSLVTIILPFIILAAEWQALNGPPAGRADDMSMGQHAGQFIIYAADQTHKLYKSVNEGELWQATQDDRVDNPICVITDPNEAWTVYIGKNGDVPVWKSTDGGQTWVPKSYGITNTNPLCFAMDPNNPARIYLGCKNQTARHSLFFTPNGGTNWYARGNQEVDVNDILIIHEPARAESIFLATSNGVYLSTDAGVTWILRKTGHFHAICNYVNNSNRRIFYGSSSDGIYKSIDGSGWRWELLPNSPNGGIDIIVQPSSPYYLLCATDGHYILRSTDQGSTWTPVKNHFVDPYTRCLLMHTANQNVVYAGTEECLYKSSDFGSDWAEKTKGFKLVSNGCDLSLSLPEAIFTSYEGTSTWKFENNNWTLRFTYPPSIGSAPPVRAGANGDVLVDDIEPNYVYVTSEVRIGIDDDYICRSTDGGWTWENVKPDTGTILNRKSLLLDPIYNNIVYLVAESPPQFWKSTDYGAHWNYHYIYYNNGLPNFYSIDATITEPQVIYLGNSSYGVAKSTDGGENWLFYNNGLPGAVINVLAIDPEIPRIIYAGTGNGVYKSTNYGASWFELGPMVYPYITDLEIDPEEPTIIYGVCKESARSRESYVICSVDRGRYGFYAGYGLPETTFDLEIDRHYPAQVYAATNAGVYILSPDFNKHLVSSSPAATSADNGRKLLHI